MRTEWKKSISRGIFLHAVKMKLEFAFKIYI